MGDALARFHSRLVGFALLAACSLQGQVAETPAKRTFTYESDVQTSFQWTTFPRWEAGVLVGYDNNHSSGPIIYTIDRNGRRDETLFTIENGARINLVDIAASPTGEIATIGSAYTADTRGTTFLARIAPDRSEQRITRVWPYCPAVVTFATDGTLWTIGHLKDPENTRIVELYVLRRFDRSGSMLSSTTIRSRGRNVADGTFLRSAQDRVGWLTGAGEYVEFSLDGREIARYDWPDGTEAARVSDLKDVSMALNDDDVVVGNGAGGKTQYFVLDRKGRTWASASMAKEQALPWVRILGFDGRTLVTTSGGGALRRLNTK